jgi:hypothetical protein
MGGKGSGTPKAALLKLDGTQVDKLGVVTETDFFSFLQLPAEHYANLEIEMTPEQALKFRNHIIRMKVGTSAIIPMVCGGPRCPVKLCPFHETKTWPLASQCPLEATLITTWMKNYIDDLEIDIQSRTEMVLINKLVECDIIDYRANIALSTDEDAWKLLKVDITDTGKATIENTNAHPILEIKERTQSTRQKVLESLIATRKERAKKIALAGAKSEGEHGQHWADLKSALKIISRIQSGETLADLKKELGEPVNADWESIE